MEPFMEELKRIVQFLRRDDSQSQELWRVLTALRGPDDGSYIVKDATTAVLRHALGLNNEDNGAITTPDSEEQIKVRSKIFAGLTLSTSGHFRAHIRDAFSALNLNLYHVNEKPVFTKEELDEASK